MRISEDVLAVLSALEFGTPRSVRITERLDPKMYRKVNEVLVAIGGKWNRGKAAHLFDADAQPLIDMAITIGEVTTHKDIGFFPTPVPLAAQLVALADLKPGMRLLEPSAGTGRIVDAMLPTKPERIVAIERDPKMRAALVERVVPGDPGSRGTDADVLWVPEVDDFMDYDPRYGTGERKRFDAVIMNPPFLRSGKGDHLDHVEHAIDMLDRGGVLIAILPAGITFRKDRRHLQLRERIEAHGDITPLPPETFRESGTDVRTVIAKVRA